MKIEPLRKLAGREEIDYAFLLSALSEYARPREKISAWLKSGDLVRVKKGLYVFGPNVALAPYSSAVLANLIYGPSAISLQYALAFYGFIPERVTTVTSITNKRNKNFTTPVGDFIYHYLNPRKYPLGITLMNASEQQPFLIATPEKALCDVIYLTCEKNTLTTLHEVETFLLYDLRIEGTALQSLQVSSLMAISKLYADKKLVLLTQFIKHWKKK